MGERLTFQILLKCGLSQTDFILLIFVSSKVRSADIFVKGYIVNILGYMARWSLWHLLDFAVTEQKQSETACQLTTAARSNKTWLRDWNSKQHSFLHVVKYCSSLDLLQYTCHFLFKVPMPSSAYRRLQNKTAFDLRVIYGWPSFQRITLLVEYHCEGLWETMNGN